MLKYFRSSFYWFFQNSPTTLSVRANDQVFIYFQNNSTTDLVVFISNSLSRGFENWKLALIIFFSVASFFMIIVGFLLWGAFVLRKKFVQYPKTIPIIDGISADTLRGELNVIESIQFRKVVSQNDAINFISTKKIKIDENANFQN